MKSLQAIANKVSFNNVVAGFMAAVFTTVVGLSSVASATPSYFNVEKGPKGPGQQTVCYTQTGIGWKAAGFKNLDHCLRYVATGAPVDQEACEGGWWFVYGFNSQKQCKDWVVLNGGGGYSGAL